MHLSNPASLGELEGDYPGYACVVEDCGAEVPYAKAALDVRALPWLTQCPPQLCTKHSLESL